jgi:hypothetical protein
MAIANGDILRMAMRWQNGAGYEFMNIWHVQVTDRGAQSQDDFLDDVMDRVTAPYTNINSYMPNNYTVVDWKIDKVAIVAGKETVTETFGIRQPPYAFGGAAATGNELPWGVAPVLKWRTGGVKSLARKFLFGFTEAQQDNGRWSAGVLTNLGLMAAVYLSPISLTSGGTVQAVIWASRASQWLPFISAAANAIAGYQRRRKEGVGR